MARSGAETKALLRDEKVRFLRLVFSDIHGVVKNVEVPDRQFEKALAGGIMFDGSSIEGFVRVQESDMLLKPDLDSLRIFPLEGQDRVALLICDVTNPDGSPFEGDPRGALRRAVESAARRGFRSMMGTEAEFFLFQLDPEGRPTTTTHDQGAYFDLSPVDRGEECRRDIVNVLEKMGFEVEAAHHEVAPGQHEIDFKYADAMRTADNLVVFRHVVRKVALKFQLHATFMPKPLYGVNGSGMHTHQSLFDLEGRANAFDDPSGEWGLSPVARWYIGGILEHARALCAVTNPTVNSYKRLVPGFEAPTNIAWSERNRSPLARVPARRGASTRVEVRMPDPSCNPYLAFAAMLAAGLDGIARQLDCGPPVNKDIDRISEREKRRMHIDNLPPSLKLAVEELVKDEVILAALGPHVAEHFIEGKLRDWQEYISVVHPWELSRYLGMY